MLNINDKNKKYIGALLLVLGFGGLLFPKITIPCLTLSAIISALFTTHKVGFKYLISSVILFSFFALLGLDALSGFFLLVYLLLFIFFRNPNRSIPELEEFSILSPADGVVINVQENALAPTEYSDIEQKWTKISIFMRVYDVHINRAPVAGKILRKNHIKGKFGYARSDIADQNNERVSLLIESSTGYAICQQVAGMLARRIVCDVNVNETVKAGETYGIIQIGSRADLYIPSHLKVEVKKDDIVKAGENFIVR